MSYICPGRREFDGPGAALVASQGRDPQLDPDEFAAELEELGVIKCIAAKLAEDPNSVVSYSFCRLCAFRLGKNLNRLGKKGDPLAQTPNPTPPLP